MKSAVIITGGKQYLIAPGDTLKVEKLPGKAGDKISFDQVLLVATEKTAKVGQPLLAGATVAAEIVRHGQRPKVTGVKMKPKKRYHRYFGHRQPFTEITITAVKAS